jgi:hypothetical protein
VVRLAAKYFGEHTMTRVAAAGEGTMPYDEQ